MKSNIKIFEYLANETSVQIGVSIFLVIYILSYFNTISQITSVLATILFIYILIKKYYKETKFVNLPFFVISIDIFIAYILKFGIISFSTYIISIIVIVYSEYKDYKRNGIYDAIELSVVYSLVKFLLFIRMFF